MLKRTKHDSASNTDNVQKVSILRCEQRLGLVGLLALILVTSIMTPLATDMYLPAIPSMPGYFDTSASVVNLTLVCYQLFFSLGMIFFGAISDKFGRRPILLFGLTAYTLGSLLSAIAPSIQTLVAFRILQGIGAGAASVVSTAMVKDCFVASVREKVLVFVQVMFVLGPVLAPLLGGQLLAYFTWRATFWVLFLIGCLCLIMAFFFKESLPPTERFQGKTFSSFTRIGAVISNKGFLFLLIPLALTAVYFMAYISSSSYIYIDFFGVSAQTYSVFFAALAAFSVVGSLLYLLLSKFLSYRFITNMLIAIMFISGMLVIFFGQSAPLMFFVSFLPAYIATSMTRPYMTSLLLGQQEGDTGTASSLINFSITACGMVGMLVAMLPWPNYVEGLGIILLITTAAITGFWAYLIHSRIPCKGLKSSNTDN